LVNFCSTKAAQQSAPIMRPNGILSSFALDKLTVSEIEKITEDLIHETRAAYDKIGSLKPEEVNFESCIQVKMESVEVGLLA